MSQAAPGHGGHAARAAKIPARARVERDMLPGRTSLSSAAPKDSGLALDETIRRVQESWAATSSSGDEPPAGDAAADNAHTEMRRLKYLHRSLPANSHLGKRSSSGAYEDVLERKRRAVGGGPHAGHESSTATSTDSDQEASRRRSAPTAGMVNGTSAEKPKDAAPVLRAVRSAPNKPLSPALRGAEPKAPGLQIFMTASGRSYKTLEDGERSAMGALIPDGYNQHDDDANPWICPIRDCRRLFRNIIALGAHFSAKHRHRNLNDNGDGTLSVVGVFKASSGQAIIPRVVSRKPLNRSEPPMASPQLPENRKPLATAPDRSSPTAGTERPVTATSRRPSRVIPPAVNPLPSRSPAPSGPTPAPTSDLAAYLRSILPSSFNLGVFSVSKEVPPMLQLTVKRRTTTEWTQRITCLKDNRAISPCILAFLLFLTGVPAEDPCPSCVTSDSGEECVVPGPSFPSFALERFAGSCAACFYRCNRWHQKNMCLLHANGGPTPGSRSRASSFLGASPAEEESEEESEGESEEDSEEEPLEGSEDNVSPVEEPAMTNGTSVLRAPPEAPAAAISRSVLNQGNLMPADVLEMEDWEVAPGTIRNTSDEPDNIAFSNAYLFSAAAVPIEEGIGFNVVTLKPGGAHKFPAGQSLRLCSLATGKLSVKMAQEGGDAGFQIGPNGMFKVLPGVVAGVRNRVYVDAVLHVTTVEM